MTKTVHPVLKKTGAVLLTVLVLVLMAVPALAVALPDAPTGYVYDGANVLSSSTESYIERTAARLPKPAARRSWWRPWISPTARTLPIMRMTSLTSGASVTRERITVS